MRGDRLLSLLLLLEVHRKMTAQELATRLEVSERTIHRDMEALSASGVPVYAERGTGGGWSLQDGYHVRLNGLNQDEVRSLFMANPAQLLADLGLEQSSKAAYLKLSAALSPASRQDADFARQRLHVDGAGWSSRSEDFPFLSLVQTAVWEQLKLAFTYESVTQCPTSSPLEERIVSPLGLIAKGQIWYLAAAVEDASIRTYRISRIRSARLLDEQANRPVDFDLAAYWEQSKRQLKEKLPYYGVKLTGDSAAVHKLKLAPYVTLIGSEASSKADWLLAELDMQSLTHAAALIGSMGGRVLVLEPQELRETLIRQARDTLALYE